MDYISHEDFKKLTTKFQAKTPKGKLIKESIVGEDDFKEGNAFTAALAKTPKGGEFKVGSKKFKDKTNYDDPSVKEYGYADKYPGSWEGKIREEEDGMFNFEKSAIESASGDTISHVEEDDYGRPIYWSTKYPEVTYFIGSGDQIIKYDGKSGERYPIGDLKHYDTNPDMGDEFSLEEDDYTIPANADSGDTNANGDINEMKEGLHTPPLQATGQTIQQVEGLNRFSVLSPTERDQLAEYIRSVKTIKEEISKLVSKAKKDGVRSSNESMGGDRTNMVMTSSTVSEADDKIKKIEAKIPEKLYTYSTMVVDKLKEAGLSDGEMMLFLKHEIEEKAKEAIMGQHDM